MFQTWLSTLWILHCEVLIVGSLSLQPCELGGPLYLLWKAVNSDERLISVLARTNSTRKMADAQNPFQIWMKRLLNYPLHIYLPPPNIRSTGVPTYIAWITADTQKVLRSESVHNQSGNEENYLVHLISPSFTFFFLSFPFFLFTLWPS